MTSRRIENEKKGGGAGFSRLRRQNPAAIKAGGKACFPAGFYCGPGPYGPGRRPPSAMNFLPGSHSRGSLIA